MIFSWTTKKQLFYFVIFLLTLFLVLVFVWWKITTPTCFDGRRNQDEEGIDCGGPCERECLGEIKELVFHWDKIFEISSGRYDAAILIENPNIFLAVSPAEYQLKLYDKNNVLIATRKGETFIGAGEIFPVFETNIDTGKRIPASAFVEFEKDLKWERIKKEKPQLVVSKKQFVNSSPFPRLSVVLDNKSVSDISDIYVVAVLYDKNGNAQAASATTADFIKSGNSGEVVFTWPAPFSEEPVLIEIFPRINQLRDNEENP